MKNTLFVITVLMLAAGALALCSCESAEYEDLTWSPSEENDQKFDDPALQLSKDLADTWIGQFDPGQNAWSWDSGVMMMGFLALSEVTGDPTYFNYAKSWIDYHILEGYHISASDLCIPGYTALQIYKKTKDQKYLRVCFDVWHYVSQVAERTHDGGLVHMGWMSGPQLWIDSLFMLGPFLMEYGALTKNEDALNEYALQLEVFRKHLRNPNTGLYRHRYDDETGEVAPMMPIFWGRGNGWVFAAHVLATDLLPYGLQAQLDFNLRSDIDQMLDSIIEFETESGRFHTILNDDSTYLETSAGLLYGYGIALGIQSGLFPQSYMEMVERWLQGAVDQIVVDEAGDTLLLGTSYGTNPGDVAYYEQVLKGENVSYGLGLFILAAVERERAGALAPLSEPTGETDEFYLHPPVPCEGTECGKFQIGRGNFNLAKEALTAQIEYDPMDGEARFYNALVDIIRFVTGVVYQIDMLYVGDIDFDEMLDWLTTNAPDNLNSANEDLGITEQDSTFSSLLDRLVLIEAGGHGAVGAREFDLGEVHVLQALSHLIIGAADLLETDKSFATPLPLNTMDLANRFLEYSWKDVGEKQSKGFHSSIQQFEGAIDHLILGIESIMAETDDQSDDFIPKNLLQLEGTFVIPGILVETDVIDLVSGLGIDEETLKSLNMPEDLLDILYEVRRILRWIDALLGGK